MTLCSIVGFMKIFLNCYHIFYNLGMIFTERVRKKGASSQKRSRARCYQARRGLKKHIF